jgi:hypothetical protein
MTTQGLGAAAGALVMAFALAGAADAAPRLFFTDLESGPASGGEGGLGVFVTIYGEGFRANRGSSTVTFGGQEVARYVLWGEDDGPRRLDRVVVQPGPAVASGPIVVTVGGVASNPLPFTVRSGGVYFVALNGNDGFPGTFEQPWLTVTHAKEQLGNGDVAFIRDGVTQTAEDAYGAALSIEASGADGLPRALVAYPGALATVGSTALEFGVRVPNNGQATTDWVVAGLHLRGWVAALAVEGGGPRRWRVVGNDISCPEGDGQTGCFAVSLGEEIAFLGNEVHDVSQSGPQPSKQYHAVYFTTDTNRVEVGWNHIHDNRTCRAIQFHSSPLCIPECGPGDTTGYNQHHLEVHDNLIHGDVCDGIVFATVDPAQGPVRAYNNVIYSVGAGPSPPDGDANYAGIYVPGATNTGPDGTGSVEVFHNTLVDCGAALGVPAGNVDRGALGRGPGSPELFLDLRDNVVVALGDEPFVEPSSSTELITGTHNLWYGADVAPTYLTGNLEADPLFVDLVGRDLRLRHGSPALDSGVDAGVVADHLGVTRPQGGGFDRGAYELARVIFSDGFESATTLAWSAVMP